MALAMYSIYYYLTPDDLDIYLAERLHLPRYISFEHFLCVYNASEANSLGVSVYFVKGRGTLEKIELLLVSGFTDTRASASESLAVQP